MRGKRAKELRRQVFSIMSVQYRLGAPAAARYRISPDGKRILCDGPRALYRGAKGTYRALCRGENLPGNPIGNPEKTARKRAARARRRETARGPKAIERLARECRPL